MTILDHPSRLADSELLRQVATHDRDAFLVLYDRFDARLLGLIMNVVRKRELAEEVLQHVMLEVWNRHAGRYDPALGAVDAWLFRLARSRAIDAVRSESRHTRVVLEEASEEFIGAIPLDGATDAAELRLALIGLSEEERLPLILAYSHGLSREQIAEQIGIPVGTVKTRIRRAVASLRAGLTGETIST